MAEYCYERNVNYYETDQMAIVHHSNYIRWMEEARLALMESISLPYDRMEEQGILIPVLSASCEYRVAFRFGDTFQVHLYPIEFNGIKMRIGYRITDPDGTLHATGETSHCFVDRNMRLVRLKKDYPDIYNPLLEWAEAGAEKE